MPVLQDGDRLHWHQLFFNRTQLRRPHGPVRSASTTAAVPRSSPRRPGLQVEPSDGGAVGRGEVEGPAPEPADGVGDVGRDGGQVGGVDVLALGGDGVGQNPGEKGSVVK